MLLALVTGQRREDIGAMKFRDVKDGRLQIEQGKTGARISIATTLRLESIGMSVRDVIDRCRDRVVSPHMIHHTSTYTHSRPGDPVHIDTISRRFSDARNATGLTWEGTPPTFHEIRSLAGREYARQGLNVQNLLGHTQQKMTDSYLNDRGREWIEVG